jgi:exopolysaccharide biosynthesis protein
LLVEGRAFADPAAEGFTDPKVYGYAIRSAVGVSRDQSELIFATSSGTLLQMANVMKRLGAYDAMNLDGGASSALWANGHYLTPPGRDIADALLVTP